MLMPPPGFPPTADSSSQWNQPQEPWPSERVPESIPMWDGEELIEIWTGVFNNMSQDLKRRLLASASTNSDPIVNEIVTSMGYTTQDIERDAYSVARYVWTNYIETTTNPLQTLWFDQIVKRMETRDRAVFEEIKAAKIRYSKGIKRNVEQIIDMKPCCSVFFCTALCQDGAFIVVNSMPYCEMHTGIALMNAYRHGCNYCLLVNLLVLRDTPKDLEHRRNAQAIIRMPIGDGGDIHLSIRRFCDIPEFRGKAHLLVKEFYSGPVGNDRPRSYQTEEKIFVDVPYYSITYTLKFQTIAWVNIERLGVNGWESIETEEEYDRISGSYFPTKHDLCVLRSNAYLDSQIRPVWSVRVCDRLSVQIWYGTTWILRCHQTHKTVVPFFFC